MSLRANSGNVQKKEGSGLAVLGMGVLISAKIRCGGPLMWTAQGA